MSGLNSFIALIILFYLVQNETFDQFKAQLQGKVLDLANEMQTQFKRKCDQNVASCEVKSYDQCQGVSTKKCFDDFPKPQVCLDGGASLSGQSSIRFPGTGSAKNLTDKEKQFVCTSALLEDKFKELDKNRNFRYGLSYIGTSEGSVRTYPSNRYLDGQNCMEYDPRFRPWYVTATSGSKNVIILIDTSGSMDGDRLQLAKKAGKSVVQTLSNNDFVGVVQFNSKAARIYSNKVTRATTQTKQNILSQIDGLTATGQTNYQAAFENGLNMIKSATKDEFGAPCLDGENIILFLTDGAPTVGEQTTSGLKEIIDDFGLNITLFSYALGRNIDTDILKQLSCQYSGILFKIEESSSSKSQLVTVMSEYYTFVSEGITIDSPVWTQPYDDAFGFGRMVTVSMPIYYVQDEIRYLLGVAGIDVVMAQLQSFGLTEQSEVVKKLISDAPCHKSNLKECDLEKLRKNSEYSQQCENQICVLDLLQEQTQLEVCFKTGSDIFKSGQEKDDYICCGLTIGAFVGIIVSILLIVIIVIVVIVCCRKKQPPSNQQHPGSANQFKPQYNNQDPYGPGGQYYDPNPPPPPPPPPPYNPYDPYMNPPPPIQGGGPYYQPQPLIYQQPPPPPPPNYPYQ